MSDAPALGVEAAFGVLALLARPRAAASGETLRLNFGGVLARKFLGVACCFFRRVEHTEVFACAFVMPDSFFVTYHAPTNDGVDKHLTFIGAD